jgi:hypothetical protein
VSSRLERPGRQSQVQPLLYYHHPAALEHDPRIWDPGHPDDPARLVALEAAMDAAGWPGCESVIATVAALAGEGEAESIAPDPLFTPRAAAHIGHFWTL